MSIINEALKKAEQEKNKIITDEPGYTSIASKSYNSKTELPKSFPPSQTVPPAAKKHNYITWILTAVLISVAVISVSLIVTKPKTKTIQPMIIAPAKENLAPIPASEPAPLPQADLNAIVPTPTLPEVPAIKLPPTPPALVLSGIVAGGPDAFAIIDGRVVKKGDIISGSKVKEIYPDRVVLEFDGEEFSLRSP